MEFPEAEWERRSESEFRKAEKEMAGREDQLRLLRQAHAEWRDARCIEADIPAFLKVSVSLRPRLTHRSLPEGVLAGTGQRTLPGEPPSTTSKTWHQ